MLLYYAALLDTLSLVTCAMLMWRYGRMSARHPRLMYLVFHILVFALRIYSMLAGSPTLFADWRVGSPVSEAEIAWAANLSQHRARDHGCCLDQSGRG